MSRVRDFDYRAVDTDPPLRDRLRHVVRTPRFLVAVTLGTLMSLVGLAGLGFGVLVVVSSGFGGAWGFLVAILFLLLGGLYVWADALHQAGEASGLAGFAKANDLALVESGSAREYAGSRFRDGDHVVEQAVRTRGGDFVEVGDSFTLAMVTMRDVRAVHDGRGAVGAREPQAFLRARLAGGSAYDPREGAHVSPALADDLRQLLGEHRVEITRSELTVFGSARLGVDDPARLREAFRLVDALAEENSRDEPSHPEATVEQRSSRRRSPVAIVVGTLALVIVVPIGFAAVMGTIVPADGLGSDRGPVVAGLAIAVLLAITGWGVRLLLTGRREKRADEQY